MPPVYGTKIADWHQQRLQMVMVPKPMLAGAKRTRTCKRYDRTKGCRQWEAAGRGEGVVAHI